MCFSATASFVTAGVTAAIGVLALQRTKTPREAPLAAAPLLFAAQQALEGFLWISLHEAPQSPAVGALALGFLLFAQVLWPVYAPLAVLLVEPRPARRRLMTPWLVIGGGVAAYLLSELIARPHGAEIRDGHIAYFAATRYSTALALAYLGATSLPLICSSQRAIVLLGALILAGCVTAYLFYWSSFQSVWCFFAAAASVVILGHFERARRLRLVDA